MNLRLAISSDQGPSDGVFAARDLRSWPKQIEEATHLASSTSDAKAMGAETRGKPRGFVRHAG